MYRNLDMQYTEVIINTYFSSKLSDHDFCEKCHWSIKRLEDYLNRRVAARANTVRKLEGAIEHLIYLPL